MNRTQHDVFRATPRQLQLLFRIAEEPTEWQPAELRSILEHQLQAPLWLDLGVAEPSSSGTSGPRTFGELLFASRPEAAWLSRVKEFAKTHYQNPQSDLPPDVGRLLYYASIFAALLHATASISSLDKAALLAGARWGATQPWITQPCATLFREAIAFLSPPDDSP